jgi:RHS repeat-associated protein
MVPGRSTGANSSQFFYTPDGSRFKQLASYGGTSEQTTYIDRLLEKVAVGSTTLWRHYIAGGSGSVAVYTRKSTGVNEIHYLTKDHLGSTDAVLDGGGAVEVRLSFSSFGGRRHEPGWTGDPTTQDWTGIAGTTRHGFTGHEMLDNLNLTHMNGRVYDQAVGRFLSADPIVQAPGFTQSFNRYSYVLNNPLSYTDPSGFTSTSLDEIIKEFCRDGCTEGIETVTVEGTWLFDATYTSRDTRSTAARPAVPGRSSEGFVGTAGVRPEHRRRYAASIAPTAAITKPSNLRPGTDIRHGTDIRQSQNLRTFAPAPWTLSPSRRRSVANKVCSSAARAAPSIGAIRPSVM